MADGLGTDIRFCNSAHLNGRLHTDGNALLLANICNGQTVHDSCQHTDVVGTGALHLAAAAILGAAPEVAAADDHADLNAHVQTLLDDIADIADHLKVQTAALAAGQSLAADLQQNSLIHRFCHFEKPPHMHIITSLF